MRCYIKGVKQRNQLRLKTMFLFLFFSSVPTLILAALAEKQLTKTFHSKKAFPIAALGTLAMLVIGATGIIATYNSEPQGAASYTPPTPTPAIVVKPSPVVVPSPISLELPKVSKDLGMDLPTAKMIFGLLEFQPVADANRLETADGFSGLIFWTNTDGMIDKARIWATFVAPTGDQAIAINDLSTARIKGFLHQINPAMSNSEIDSFMAESANALTNGQTTFVKVSAGQKIFFELFEAEGNVTVAVEPAH